ncbi:MAG: DUF72 domain-containing protein [Betaproteobacteria bacterium]
MIDRRPQDSSDDPAPVALARVEAAAAGEDLLRLGRRLPRGVYLGTSSWSFPGWRGLVYRDERAEADLARHGLSAYAQHPVLRAVGLDRGFYRPLSRSDYARYAAQVPPAFRFLIKAPAAVTDAVVRGDGGAPAADNPHFLDVAAATETFVLPALAGLGEKAGPLVFQLSPLPRPWLRDEALVALVERLGAFFAALPQTVDGRAPLYALELRNGQLLTPRLVRSLRAVGVRLCLGLHAKMPDVQRQSSALRAMDASDDDGEAWRLKGPLVVRWSLHAGLRYEEARQRYAPFDRLMDVDVFTRGTLAHLIHVAQRSGQPAYVIVNNKAEGSAPLTCIELAQAVVGK